VTQFDDIIFDILEVLLYHNQFERPLIGQITLLQITKTQKPKLSNIFTKFWKSGRCTRNLTTVLWKQIWAEFEKSRTL